MSSPRRNGVKRLLLACGAVTGPLFVAVFLVVGAVRADYDPVRHPVSSLALGPHGWTQTANFLLAGVLTTAFAVGLHRHRAHGRGARLLPSLVALWGLGLIGAGMFVTDPVSGYPPGTPPLPEQPSWQGATHDLVAIVGFAALTLACFVQAGRDARARRPAWALASAFAGVAFAVLLELSSLGFGQVEPLVASAGLLQRATVIVGLGWLSAVAVRSLRAAARQAPPEAP